MLKKKKRRKKVKTRNLLVFERSYTPWKGRGKNPVSCYPVLL